MIGTGIVEVNDLFVGVDPGDDQEVIGFAALVAGVPNDRRINPSDDLAVAGACPVISPTTSATDTRPQLSSSDCCCQCLAAAAGLPYTPLDDGLFDAALLVADDAPGDAATWPHPDARATTAMPMQALRAAVRTAIATREVDMVATEGKVAPSGRVSTAN